VHWLGTGSRSWLGRMTPYSRAPSRPRLLSGCSRELLSDRCTRSPADFRGSRAGERYSAGSRSAVVGPPDCGNDTLYAQHAPEPHADDDAARVEASMVGVANREAEAVQALLKVVDA
jgi:hypothetical protein